MRRRTIRAAGLRFAASIILGAGATLAPTTLAEAGGTGSISITIRERTDIIDVDDVTPLLHWAGDGVDLGPAPAGDPLFEALPEGCTVLDPPDIERTETGIDESSESSQEIDSGPWVYGEHFTGDPDDPFTWVAFKDYDIDVTITLVETITRTHHVSEIHTHGVVCSDAPTTTVALAPTTSVPATSAPPTTAPATTPGPAAAAPATAAAAIAGQPSYTG